MVGRGLNELGVLADLCREIDQGCDDPDRTKELRYGRQTFDEMMNGWLKYYYDQPLDGSGKVEQGSPEEGGRRIERDARRER